MKNEVFNKKTQKMLESLGAVHTHTHTGSFISNAQAFINHRKQKDTLLS